MQLTWAVLWCCHTWQLFIPGECHLQTALQLPSCSCSCPSGCGDPQQEDKPIALVLWAGPGLEELLFAMVFLPLFLIRGDFFYSSACYKWEDGISSPYSMHRNILCSCYLSAKFELIYFLEFGERKC